MNSALSRDLPAAFRPVEVQQAGTGATSLVEHPESLICLAQLDRWPLLVPAPPSTLSIRSAEEWACCTKQHQWSDSEKCLCK